MKKILAFVCIGIAFTTLMFLGTWQIKRLSWKESFIHKLDKEYKYADKRPFINLAKLNQEPSDTVRYGRLQGRFDYSKEILVGPKPREGEVGYNVVTPFKTSTGNIILVNRGWIALADKEQITKTQPQGTIELTGLFRVPDWNMFTPNNSPENDVWTKLDIHQIAQAKHLFNISDFMLYAAKSSKNFEPVLLHEDKWYPRNKHKQYAIFWFTMGFILLVLIGLFLRKEKKEKN